MARPESRFIQKLTKTQVQELERLRDHGNNSRIRHRAHAILLSFHGSSMNELARIFQTSRNTIENWLNRWEASGLAGIADKSRPGSPPKLNQDEQLQAIQILKESPQSINVALVKLKEETGIEVSPDTLKRLAKKHDLVWKRMRKSLRSKRDQKNFATSSGIEDSSTERQKRRS